MNVSTLYNVPVLKVSMPHTTHHQSQHPLERADGASIQVTYTVYRASVGFIIIKDGDTHSQTLKALYWLEWAILLLSRQYY